MLLSVLLELVWWVNPARMIAMHCEGRTKNRIAQTIAFIK